MNEFEADYLCVGVCRIDPDSGYCLGCGRPPLSFDGPEVVAGVDRYPVASELILATPADRRDA